MGRIGKRLLIVDEVGYIPFDQDAANLLFQLVSSRYEHASLVMTSNLPFARWGDVFGDLTIASAMIDCALARPSRSKRRGRQFSDPFRELMHEDKSPPYGGL